jgi:hypothetical protein
MSHDGASSESLTDTTPRAMERYLERLRATPPRARLARALRLSAQVRAATMSDVRRGHPGATEQELAVEFLRRTYGDDIAARYVAHRTR